MFHHCCVLFPCKKSSNHGLDFCDTLRDKHWMERGKTRGKEVEVEIDRKAERERLRLRLELSVWVIAESYWVKVCEIESECACVRVCEREVEKQIETL